MNLSPQKRLAADVLGVGENRVWMDPDASGEISQAVTRQDVRDLVEEGHIRSKDEKGQSRGRARERDEKRKKRRGTGEGKRKGTSGARSPEKREWVNRVRAQRKFLKELREDGTLDPSTYRKFYRLSKGGTYPDVEHLKTALESEGHMEAEDE